MLTHAQRNGTLAVHYEGKVSMSEDLVIRHCSPTLAGIKTGNLFSCDCPCRKELTKALSGLNRKLVPRGIRILPLRVCGGRALIYACRPHALESDLADQRVRELLLQYGYTPENLNACVLHLIRRIRTAEEFPHEIGLFLSYPPRMFWGSSITRPAITSAWAAGRYTETSGKQKALLKNIICAAGFIFSSGSKGNPSSSLP